MYDSLACPDYGDVIDIQIPSMGNLPSDHAATCTGPICQRLTRVKYSACQFS